MWLMMISYFLFMQLLKGCSMNFHQILQRFSSHRKDVNLSIFDKNALSRKSLQNLLLEYVYFQCGKQKSLLKVVQSLYAEPITSPVVAFLLKKTIFKHFCGGQTFNECLPRMDALFQQHRISTILDYSCEDAYNEDQFQRNYENKMELFHQLEKEYRPESTITDTVRKPFCLQNIVPFIPLKFTSLVSPSLLEKITSLLEQQPLGMKEKEDEILLMLSSALTAEELKSFQSAINRLTKLCQKAKELQISLLIDAEISTRQHAVDCIWRLLALECNQLHSRELSLSHFPVIYNTYQCYLKNSKQRIERDYEFCQKNNLVFGVKLVRGAYMRTENQISEIMKKNYPIFNTKEQTDNNYNEITSFLLSKINEKPSSSSECMKNNVFILFATHNRDSLSLVLENMKRYGISKSFSAVHFAQILGMTDNLTYGLGKEGYNVSKLILYGKFEELMPWMLRRLEENQDSLGGLHLESDVIKDAIRSRLESTLRL
jgi:hypothetical protein